MSLAGLSVTELIYLSIGIISIGIALIVFIKARRTLGYKHFKFKLKRVAYADTVFLLEGGGYAFDALPISTQGNKSFLDDKNDKYGYAPVANGLAILEENNAIPIVRGGWVEEPVEKTAKSAMNIELPQDGKPLPEKDVTKIFRWVINKGKLKSALIRPLTRWSSKELDSAIKSKVIEELLDIPLKMIDLITLILVVAIIGATVYYGAQNTQLLQAILEKVTVDPYVPIP